MATRCFPSPIFLCLLVATVAAAAPRRGARQVDAFSSLLFHGGFGGARYKQSPVFDATPDLSSRKFDQQGTKDGDKIASLPGQPGPADFDQYAGYVTVDAAHGKALFYYFAEAPKSGSSSKPLLLWFNGGPGCSSFGYGAMEELGPFRVKSDGKTLYENPYAWNKAANVLFVESPVGVGFSYSNVTKDYTANGDKSTAADAYVFLVNWLERFPEYKGRDFYIAGESYAGHYVPQLADTILQQGGKQVGINLKGIAIGNPAIDDEADSRGIFDYIWTHALISDDTIRRIRTYCNFSDESGGQLKPCTQAVEEAVATFNEINFYNIYAPPCRNSSTAKPPPSVEQFDPCTEDYIAAYLNNGAVQEALHVNVGKAVQPWTGCSDVITKWVDAASTLLPVIRKLLANSIRVWVYSGDVDARVPVTATRYAINKLELAVVAPWRSWAANDDVGGFVEGYEGDLWLVTVREAGHEVPSYQPLRALVMIRSFLAGEELPRFKVG